MNYFQNIEDILNKNNVSVINYLNIIFESNVLDDYIFYIMN